MVATVAVGDDYTHRVQILKRLGDIHPHAVLPSLVRGREHANEVEVKRPILGPSRVERDGKGVVGVGRIELGSKLDLVLDPLVAHSLGLNLHGAEHVIRQRRLERRGKGALVGTLHPERPGVGLLLHVHAPVSVVGEANDATARLARRNIHRSGQHLGERGVELVDGELRAVDRGVSVQRDREGLAVLEGAVPDQLGVEAAIAGVVDVLRSCKLIMFMDCNPTLE